MPKKNFNPTRNMEKYMQLFFDVNQNLSKKDIAKTIGISIQAVYKWYRNPVFVDWLNSFRERIINSSLADIYKTSSRKSKAGDYNFSRLLLEMSGDYTPRSESKNVNINKNDGLETLSEEDLIKGFKKDLDIYEANIKKQKE